MADNRSGCLLIWTEARVKPVIASINGLLQ